MIVKSENPDMLTLKEGKVMGRKWRDKNFATLATCPSHGNFATFNPHDL